MGRVRREVLDEGISARDSLPCSEKSISRRPIGAVRVLRSPRDDFSAVGSEAVPTPSRHHPSGGSWYYFSARYLFPLSSISSILRTGGDAVVSPRRRDDMARQDNTRQDKKRKEKTRQDKARKD